MSNRCPKCKHGRHKLHESTYVDKDGVEKRCECKVCVQPATKPQN